MRDIGGYGPGRHGDRLGTASGRLGEAAGDEAGLDGRSVDQRAGGEAERNRTIAPPELVERFAGLMHGRAGADKAQDRDKDRDGQDGRAGTIEPGDRLLATVETRSPWPLGPGPVVPADASTAPRDTGRTERLARAIDTAIKAELRPHPNAPVKINLAVEDIPGLNGIVLSMSASEIDLVLIRPATAAAALDSAAGDLADRLRNRFGKKVVRVYERTAETATASAVSAAGSADAGGRRS